MLFFLTIVFTLDGSSLNEVPLKEQVEKLNRENTEHSLVNAEASFQSQENAGREGKRKGEPTELFLDGSNADASQTEEERKESKESKDVEDEGDSSDDTEAEEEDQQTEDCSEENGRKVEDKRLEGETEEPSDLENVISETSKASQERYFQPLYSLVFTVAEFILTLSCRTMLTKTSEIKRKESHQN